VYYDDRTDRYVSLLYSYVYSLIYWFKENPTHWLWLIEDQITLFLVNRASYPILSPVITSTPGTLFHQRQHSWFGTLIVFYIPNGSFRYKFCFLKPDMSCSFNDVNPSPPEDYFQKWMNIPTSILSISWLLFLFLSKYTLFLTGHWTMTNLRRISWTVVLKLHKWWQGWRSWRQRG
jgi:hypothetical protein